MAQNPRFSLYLKLVGNDVLGYAISGGDGTDRSLITPQAMFDVVF